MHLLNICIYCIYFVCVFSFIIYFLLTFIILNSLLNHFYNILYIYIYLSIITIFATVLILNLIKVTNYIICEISDAYIYSLEIPWRILHVPR